MPYRNDPRARRTSYLHTVAKIAAKAATDDMVKPKSTFNLEASKIGGSGYGTVDSGTDDTAADVIITDSAPIVVTGDPVTGYDIGFLPPGDEGDVLTVIGGTWTSAAPGAGSCSIGLEGSIGTPQSVTCGDTITILPGDGVVSTEASATDTITINTEWERVDVIMGGYSYLHPVGTDVCIAAYVDEGVIAAVTGENGDGVGVAGISLESGFAGVKGLNNAAGGIAVEGEAQDGSAGSFSNDSDTIPTISAANNSTNNAAHSGSFSIGDSQAAIITNNADFVSNIEPDTPETGTTRLFAYNGDDGKLYYKLDDGTVVGPLGAAGASYTDEEAQDAVGTILVDSASIDFTYTDATPEITAVVKPDGINDTHIDWGTGANQVSTDDVPEGATNKFFTDERAQDAVGAALIDTTEIDLHYNDGSNEISADIRANSVIESKLNLTDVTTRDVNNSRHGFCPKAIDDNNQFLRSDGAWSDALAPDQNNQTVNGCTIDSGLTNGDTLKLRGRATTGGVWQDLIKLTTGALAALLDFPQGFTYAGGAIPVTAGGTGGTTAGEARNNLSAASISNILKPVYNVQHDSTQVSSSTDDTGFVTYLGCAPKKVASGNVVHVSCQVTTAYVSAGAGTWCEIALLKGSINLNGDPTLTVVGTVTIATAGGTGMKDYSVTLTADINAGDDLWIGFGSKATTTRAIYRGIPALTGMSTGLCASKPTQGAFSALPANTVFTINNTSSMISAWALF